MPLLIFVCLLLGAVNLIVMALILAGYLRPRAARQQFTFTHIFRYRSETQEENVRPEDEAEPPAVSDDEPDDEKEVTRGVIDALRGLGFTVHESFFDPQPHHLGDLFVFPYPHDEACDHCGGEMRVFMEVIRHAGSGGGTVAVDLNEVGEVCDHCGHFRRHDEEDIEPFGVFRIGPPHSSNMFAFLERLPPDAVNEITRTAYLRELALNERALQGQLFRVRQQIMRAKIAAEEEEDG